MAPKHLQLGAWNVLRQQEKVKKCVQHQQPGLVIRILEAAIKVYMWLVGEGGL